MDLFLGYHANPDNPAHSDFELVKQLRAMTEVCARLGMGDGATDIWGIFDALGYDPGQKERCLRIIADMQQLYSLTVAVQIEFDS